MKAKVKELFLEALRSGKYKQTVGQLRDDATNVDQVYFCALGLLYELHRIRTKRGVWLNESDYAVKSKTGRALKGKKGKWELDDGISLHPIVAKWAGLEDNPDFSLRHRHEVQPMWFLNDNERLSFKQIALLIERQIPAN